MKFISKNFIILFACCCSFSAYSQCLQIDGIPDLTLPTEVCSGEPVTLCLPYTNLDLACLNYDFTANIDNTVTVEDVGGQLCITVTANNPTCAPVDAIVTINDLSCCDGSEPCADLGFPIGCIGLGTVVTFPLDLDPIIVYPTNFAVVTVDPDCAGEAGSATLTAEDGTECEVQVGTPGMENVCPDLTDTDAELTYDFSAFTNPCYTGETGTVGPIDCLVTCAACPAVTAVTANPGGACDGEMVTICVDFDGPADDVTVNGAGPAAAGDTQICYDEVTANMTCALIIQTSTPDVICTLDGAPIAADDAVWDAFPAPFSTAITDDGSACGTPSVDLLAADGTVCSTMTGPACAADGETYDYDFSADPIITDLAGAPAACVPGAFSGTITCAACAGGGAVCDAMAGEPLVTPEEVCEADAAAFDLSTKFDPATGGYDDGMGNIDPVNTNYVAVDQATGDILAVATSAAMIDLSGAPVGTVACVYQLAYTQALLDDVTGFVDNLLCSTLCIPITGPCLGDLGYCPGVTPAELAPFLDILNQFFGFNETQICNFLDNQIITIPDPTGLFGDVEVDLAANGLDFCADKSDAPYCVEIIDCAVACEADAPELLPAEGDCAADDGDMMETPFTWPVDPAGTENTTAPYITEYIVTDAATGNIIGVFPTLAAAEAAANMEITTDADGNATACIQPINHDSANFEALVTDLDAQTGGLLCGAGIIVCPVTTLEALYAGLAGAGVAIDAATVVGLVGAPNAGNPGLDLGALLGLPIPLVVDVPPFCYELGEEVCAVNAACPVDACMLDAVADITGTCDDNGTPNDPADDTFTYTITVTGTSTGASYDISGGDTQTGLTYGAAAGPFGPFPISGGNLALTITDVTDAACTQTANVIAPAPCSTPPTCNISVSISNYACDDGGTPDDPSDDMVTFDYTVMDVGGTGTTWSSDQGDAGVAYGTTIMAGPILADGTTWTINVSEDSDPMGCTASASQALNDCAPVENIPTVGEWGLIILGLLMSITAIVGIRQRREEEAYS